MKQTLLRNIDIRLELMAGEVMRVNEVLDLTRHGPGRSIGDADHPQSRAKVVFIV